jgi:predicted nucleic acid-binding protein
MGVTVLDAGILIGLLESSDAHHDRASAALVAELEARSHLALPTSAYAEVLVRPFQLDSDGVETVRRLVRHLALELVTITPGIAERAAQIRATAVPRLKLPDAITLAVAVELDADRVLTTDARWPTPTAVGLRGAIVVV